MSTCISTENLRKFGREGALSCSDALEILKYMGASGIHMKVVPACILVRRYRFEKTS